MKILDVPFVGNPENPSDKCVPAVLAMVLGYFMPERKLTMTEIEQMCGYVSGKGTWKAQMMLSLAALGFQTKWIEDFDNYAFIKDPEDYLATIWTKSR